MTAVHRNTSMEPSASTAAGNAPSGVRPGSPSSSANNPALYFPKSGLGTPDFFYFGGGSGSAGAGSAGSLTGQATPSWFKGTLHAKESPLKREGEDEDADAEGDNDDSDGHPSHSRNVSSNRSANTTRTARDGDEGEAKGSADVEDGKRRALVR